MLGRTSRLTWATLLALAVVTILATTGAAASALNVDAGSSRQATPLDTQQPVEGEAFGGQQPYNYTWTIDGATERFEDPHARSTSVDLDGLSGTVELTFTVEDAAGDVASDTVRYHVAAPVAEPVRETLQFGPGVPDEIVGASGADQQNEDVTFSVPADTDRIVAQLTWQEGPRGLVLFHNDLDLVLLDPDDAEASGNQGRTPGHPETVTVDDPEPGTWTARVEAWLNGPEDAQLEIHLLDTATLPNAKIQTPHTFGTQDTQTLHGKTGVDRATAAWDVDDDGSIDDTGNETTLDIEPGTQRVRYRATTPAGFESVDTATARVVDTAEHAIPLHCGGREHWQAPAEFSHSLGTCWMHGGHQTYVLDEPMAVEGGEGFVFSVEQQFSPPTEYEDPPFDTPIHVQTSIDGQTWTDVADVEYDFLEDPRDGSIGLDTRQKLHYSFDTEEPRQVQFVRFHQPRSAAQGLSGFLDRSNLILLANDTDSEQPAPTTEEGSVDLSCSEGDVLEDFFDTHPCWFGGINRYDAPSFFHTYEPGRGTTVTSAEATVQVAPWRTDDWFIPIRVPVGIDTGSTPPVELQPDDVDRQVDQTQQTRVFLQASPDGHQWTTIGNETVLFGERSTFEVSLEQPEPARFVRLVTDHHPLSDEYRSAPPLHHPEAFFLFSEVTVTGQVPVEG